MYVLIVVMLNIVSNNTSSTIREIPSPQVAMQEFSSEKACMFAGKVVLKNAGEMAPRIKASCVPKGDGYGH